MNTRIQQFTAHAIDHSKSKATLEAMPQDAELDAYLLGLLAWANEEEDVRQFHFADKETQVCSAIKKVVAGELLNVVADSIANRLLKKESEKLDQVRHLKGVQEGMLLQAVFERDGTVGVLLAKVELSEFLRRDNFRSDRGFDKKHRLLKFCLIEFTTGGEIATVHVGDTHATIAKFWWADFLELTEERTDSFNTKNAFVALDLFLANEVKKKHPRDYPALYNSVLRIFKQNRSFKYTAFLDDVFDNYKPHDSNLNMVELKKRAKSLPSKRKFDPNFTILPDEIRHKFKKTYTLSPQIELRVDGVVNDDQISAYSLEDGTKGVFVKSEEGYQQFPSLQSIVNKSVYASFELKESAPVKTVNVQAN